MATMTASIDQAERIVPMALAGDDAAFRWIVETFSSDMRQVAFIICGDLALAEDALAASWPIAWRKLGALRKPSSLRPWLVSIAANEARHIARRTARRAVREIPVDDSGPTAALGDGGSHDPARDRAESIDLANALARLDPSDRVLLALRYVAGLNSTELARVTRLTPAGTRARLQRLLDRLRTELRDD